VRCGTVRLLGDEQWNGVDDRIAIVRCIQRLLVRLPLTSSWLTNALLMLKADPQMPLKIYPDSVPGDPPAASVSPLTYLPTDGVLDWATSTP